MALRKKMPSATLAAFSLMLSVANASTSASATPEVNATVETPWGFSYSDSSPTGPQRWGYLRDEWKPCRAGRRQSPIDISRSRPMDANLPLNTGYSDGPLTIKNNGYDMTVEFSNGGFLWIKGKQYRLRQLHWHAPSEHTIEGKRSPLEMHMVHVSEANEIAVVGILYKSDDRRPDPFISQLETHLKTASRLGPGACVPVAKPPVGPYDAVGPGDSYFRYNGSLTTPPCSEGVLWTVMAQEQTVSKYQRDLLKKAIHDPAGKNARPLQPLNGREIVSFDVDTAAGAEAV